MDLLLSSTLPSILVPALPFTFITPSMHVISSITLRGTQPPPGLTFTKYYFNPHLEDMKRKFEEVKAMGSATAEEWIKGLESDGKEKLADAARWEQWETSGGLRSVKMVRSNEAQGSSSQASHLKPGIKTSSIDSNSSNSTPLTNGPATEGDGSPVHPANTHGM
jgi:hypothetical protein